MPYRPDPVPPGAISPSIMLNSSVAPPMDVYESWNESTAPVDVTVVAVANAADCGTPKRASVPSLAAPTACGTVPWCGALGRLVHGQAADQDDRHHRDDGEALALVPDQPAEGARQREADHQQQEDLQRVGPARRVLERVRGVDVVEAAAVGAELLDDLLRGDRTAGDELRRTPERVHRGAGGEVLHHAGGDEDDRADERDREQDPHARPGQVDPEVAELRRRPAGRRSPVRARSRRPCRRRPRRSSAPRGRPSGRGGPWSTHPSTPASWCSSRTTRRC